jgi:hypothetical protein
MRRPVSNINTATSCRGCFSSTRNKWGFQRSWTPILEESRTAFRDEPEHLRSVATLAVRLCKKCSASSGKTYPERSEGRMALAEKGARGKGRQPLSPHQHTAARSVSSAPNQGSLVRTNRVDGIVKAPPSQTIYRAIVSFRQRLTTEHNLLRERSAQVARV